MKRGLILLSVLVGAACLIGAEVPEWKLPHGSRAIFDLKKLSETPKTFKVELPCREAWNGKNAEGVQPIFIEGEPWQGKATRIFAWWGLPEGASPSNKVPVMVLVHGGGGTASSQWVKTWNRRGYAAISMDTCGGIPQGEKSPHHPRHPWSGPDGWETVVPDDPDIHNHWPYQAVTAVMRCHSWMRSLPEVDPTRSGLTGFSWGGYLTSFIGAVDHRFRFTAPVYGCGYTQNNFEWRNHKWVLPTSVDKHRAWFALWDPSEYIQSPRYEKGVHYLWTDGTNDRWYTLDMIRMSCNLLDDCTPLNLALRLRMPHGGPPAGDPPEITALANYHLKGGKPLVDITHAWEQGGQLTVQFESHGRAIKRAELLYTTDANPVFQKRPWFALPVPNFDPAKGEVTVTLPAQTTMYYLNIIQHDGLVASSRIFQRESWGLVDNPRNPNTDWMKGKRGVFSHYLFDSDMLARMGEFDVEGLANQLAEMKADWFCLTLGQNSGTFCSPNATYDRVCGYAPGTHCSTRDIPAELIPALTKRGIKFMLYLPCQPPKRDAHAEEAFGFPAGPVGEDRLINAEGAARWASVIEEWSRRYGAGVAGWWFDGAYRWCRFNDQIAGLYAAAVKRGNPQAVVAFNEGVVMPMRRWTQAGDYTAGEVNEPFRVSCAGRWLGDRQWHLLTFCGKRWCHPTCRYSDAQWINWLKPTLAAGGAVTSASRVCVQRSAPTSLFGGMTSR